MNCSAPNGEKSWYPESRRGERFQSPNLSAARAFAFAASSSRFLGGAVVSSERRRRIDAPATSSMAARNASSLAFEGLVKPLIFLTNWSEAARTSSSVTGGSKLKSVLIFLHIVTSDLQLIAVPCDNKQKVQAVLIRARRAWNSASASCATST